MNVNSMFPSKYVTAADLAGQDVPVTIVRCEIEAVGGPGEAEDLPVAYFAGMQKGLVLNKTNAFTIAALYGEESEQWIGKVITLFPTETSFQGKMVACIRVRSTPPVAPPPTAPLPAPAPAPVQSAAPAAPPSF